jgi:hypothetical protein
MQPYVVYQVETRTLGWEWVVAKLALSKPGFCRNLMQTTGLCQIAGSIVVLDMETP